MDLDVVDTNLRQVRELLERNDVRSAIQLIEAMLPADQADVFEELPPEQQQALLPRLDTEDAADILEELEDGDAAALAARLDPRALAHIIDEMEPDEAADLLGDLDPILSSEALARMREADDVRPLLLHADQTAGGLMTSEYLAFPAHMRAGQALGALRRWEPKGVEVPYLFVVDDQGRLVGVASLFDVLRADPTARLETLMAEEVHRARVTDDQEAAARLMARYDLVAVPVVDENERLVGVITVDDLVEVLEDEATEDIQQMGATLPLDRPYLDTNILSVAWKRVGWLMLLFITATLTGTVMQLYEAQLEQLIVLSFFIPLLIDTGGNAGSQTIATVIRALAVGEVELRDGLRVLWKELRTAIVLGSLVGLMAFVRVALWGMGLDVGFVVGASVLGIIVWANCMGSLLPLIAAKVGIDPALVSGPLLTTIVDTTGLLLYFNVARLVLGI